jgi:hypothetical protein
MTPLNNLSDLPKNLRSSLPTIGEIENEFAFSTIKKSANVNPANSIVNPAIFIGKQIY